jgi:hypothetical protein
MPLATYTDANKHLDENKLKFTSENEAEPEAQEADRIVRAKLGDLFPDQVNEWAFNSDDFPTPEIIKEAASLLMASYRYAKRYSEATLGSNPYADRLEARAMFLLNGILDGSIDLTDVDYDSDNEPGFGQADFWPNNSTTVGAAAYEETVHSLFPETAPSRAFDVGKQF